MQQPFHWSSSLENRASRLAQEVRRLRMRPLHPEAVRSLQKWFRLDHVFHSNAIEGNTLTLAETKAVIEDGLTVAGKSLREHSEAVDLAAAVDYVFDLVARGEGPFDQSTVRSIHQLVLRDTDREEAGRYRRSPNRISGSAYPTTEPVLIPEMMDDYGEWLKGPSTPDDALLRAAVAHTWLVKVHPFADGNGRTARLLMNLVLLRAGYPVTTIRKEDRPRYYSALETSHSGDLEPWAELLLDRCEESLKAYVRAQEEAERADVALEGLTHKLSGTTQGEPADFALWKASVDELLDNIQRMVEKLGTTENSSTPSPFPIQLQRERYSYDGWRKTWIQPSMRFNVAAIRVGGYTLLFVVVPPAAWIPPEEKTLPVRLQPMGIRLELFRWWQAAPVRGQFRVLRKNGVYSGVSASTLALELVEDLVNGVLT